MRRPVLAFLTAALIGAGASAAARAEETALPQKHWSFQGIFGTYDRAAVQRGFQVYKEICSACHSMNLVHYRDLQAVGFSEDQVKQIAASVQVTDGPNDAGEMFERPGKPSDPFKAPFPNDNAARAANNGALPPDLSLMSKARQGGPDYTYGIMTGFGEPPAGVTIAQGMNYNKYFPGHQIAMPPPLQDGRVTYADGTPATVEQMAHDVVTFLTWAANPEMVERKQIGWRWVLFFLIMTGLTYAVKRKVWADVH